jgi:iron(III) transport system ATP-binding protein
MSQITVSIENLTKSFADVVAVDALSLSIEQGEFVALLGPSGCGKTTTLRLLAGFEAPDAGIIQIGGQMVTGPGVFAPPEKRKVGMVFQSYALFPHLTVAKNVAYGLSKEAARAGQVQEVLEMVRLSGLEDRLPHELSGGQQQRVALARALAPKPNLILLDEPFSNLDAGLRVAVRAEVRDILRRANITTLFVTHDQEEALSLSNTVAVMMAGKLMQIASPHILYQRPASREVATFVGDANFLPGSANDGVVTCEFGRLPIHDNRNGPVEVMLRPEEIGLTLDENGPAAILERQYYGHDQLLTCRLESGTIIQARLVGLNNDFIPGRRVRLTFPERVMVFPVSG